MDTTYTKYISDFFYKHYNDDIRLQDNFFYLKLHALFNCLTPFEIITLYFKHSVNGDKLRDVLLNFIKKKAEAKSIDFSLIAKDLISDYVNQSYKLQITYRTFLSQVIQYLDKEIIKDYFYLFVKSKRKNDRKKAYEVAKFLWTEVEELIWDNLNIFDDEEAIILIIQYSESSKIIEQFESIWFKDFTSNWTKKQLLVKTHLENIKHFSFLKEYEPTFYIQALVIRNKPISQKFLYSVINKMKEEKNYFLFYYLGLAKNWELLIESIENIDTKRQY